MAIEPKKFDFSNRLFTISVILIAIILIYGFFQLFYQFKMLNQQGYNQISVSGEGKVYSVADIATLTLGIETQGKDVKEITQKNVSIMNKIIEGLKKLGVADKDIKTAQYSVSPRYNWTEDRGRTLEGYTISQNVDLKIRDFTKIGDVLNMATENGANVVTDLQFSIDDPEKFKSEAREAAIKQAKEKAEILARQTGIKLGEIVNVYEDSYNSGVISYDESAKIMSAMPSGGGVSAQVEPGQQKVSVTISLVYKIK